MMLYNSIDLLEFHRDTRVHSPQSREAHRHICLALVTKEGRVTFGFLGTVHAAYAGHITLCGLRKEAGHRRDTLCLAFWDPSVNVAQVVKTLRNKKRAS